MRICVSPNGRDTFAGEGPVDEVLVATIDGIAFVRRESGTWRAAERALRGLHISSIHVEEKRGGIFAGVHGEGLYRSVDGGKSWQLKADGLQQRHVYTITSVEKSGHTVLYCGTEPAHLYQSVNYGDSWTELPALRNVPDVDKWTFPAPPKIAHVKNIRFDRRDPATMYACIEQGALLRSTDEGQTWTELAGYSKPDDAVYRDVHRIVMRPSNPDQFYIDGGNGLYFTPDAGRSWEHLTKRDFRIGYPDGLVISPKDENIIFMAGAAGVPSTWRTAHTANPAVLRSGDAGRTWRELRAGLPADLHGNIEALSLFAWGRTFGLAFATTDGDVYVSEDEGEGWERIASGLPPVSKVTHYVNAGSAA